MTPPDWREQREVTLKVDGFTLGAAFLVAAVAVLVLVKMNPRRVNDAGKGEVDR